MLKGIDRQLVKFMGKEIKKITLVKAEDGVGYTEAIIIVDGNKFSIRCQEDSVLGRLSFKF